eukprot:TRINITY_DN2205_c0_g1_i1.p1 TRINITY_DN2205_c0_g1~~TRINITY_DN2205_c0_g1_i1.p1  ORF type:complete len:467 (-),score=63.51 TRINITY_DN2205_c0_g1_i1:385-1785(-)
MQRVVGVRSLPYRGGSFQGASQRGDFENCCEEQERPSRASTLWGRGEEMDPLVGSSQRDSSMGAIPLCPPRSKKSAGNSNFRRRRFIKFVLASILLLLILAAVNFSWQGAVKREADAEVLVETRRVPAEVAWKIQTGLWASVPTNRTLVIYVFSNTDDFYLQNLLRFVRMGIAPDNKDGSEGEPVDYYIFLNGIDDKVKALLPVLPTKRARYVEHKNECFDFGTIGWAFKKPGLIQLWLYQYILWLNSSVRGPYLPPGHHPGIRWHSVLTSRLDKDVKMVGATVTCQYTPHIQSYVVATDQVGLGVLLSNETIFGCHETLLQTVFSSELGSSTEILNAGYNIDTLEKTYQGLDWRVVSPETRNCWNHLNPVHHFNIFKSSDAIIFELMFIKVKKEYMEHPLCVRAKLIDQASITKKCFDWKFYCDQMLHSEPEEEQQQPPVCNLDTAWESFSGGGMNEGRPYRMVC